MNYRNLFSVFCALFVLNVQLVAQTASDAYTNYIEQYKTLAIDQMQRHRIPASITLAQGLLESAAGQSRLARVANNHFGIKATSDWTGPVVLADDDAKDEQFRKYNSVQESYEDHSLFLQRPRYNALYQLPITDYKAWAKTLRQCGYATNPRYADNLISIIERYNLVQYDYYGSAAPKQKKSKKRKKLGSLPVNTPSAEERTLEISHDYLLAHNLGMTNGAYYIIVKPGDNLKSVAKATGKDIRKIRRYNNIPRGGEVYPGQIIYLTKKADSNLAMRGQAHTVQNGESLYDIAQRYGVKLKSLYKINGLDKDYETRVGDRILLCR